MRYRNLLALLLLVSMASVLWAKPAKEITPREPGMAQKLGLAKELPNIELAVASKGDFASTEFVVTLTDVEDLIVGQAPMLGLQWEDGEQVHWLLGTPAKVGPSSWKFVGADLRLPPTGPPKGDAEYTAAVILRDPEASPYSRGLTTLTYKSRPVVALQD